MPVPSTITEETQFTSWKIYGRARIPGRNDLRSCLTVLSSSNHYNFMTIWLYGDVCEGPSADCECSQPIATKRTGGEGGINIHRLNFANNTGKFLL
jgi:hypothetical protein